MTLKFLETFFDIESLKPLIPSFHDLVAITYRNNIINQRKLCLPIDKAVRQNNIIITIPVIRSYNIRLLRQAELEKRNVGIFQKSQNVSLLAMVAIDMHFSNKSTVSTPTTHSESSMTSGEEMLKKIALSSGLLKKSM